MSFIPEQHARHVCNELTKVIKKHFVDYKWRIVYVKEFDSFQVQGIYKKSGDHVNIILPVFEAQQYFRKWATPNARLTLEAKKYLLPIVNFACTSVTKETNLGLH